MVTKISVGLNGVLLSDVDDSIVLQGIDEQAPVWNPTAANRGGLLGQYYLTTEKRYRDVIVSFAIRNISNYAERQNVYNKVCAWASAGGRLTVNYRSGQELRVKCISLPALGNVTQWANPMQMTFRAYNVPQWIAPYPTGYSDFEADSTSKTVTLTVDGTAGSKLWAQLQNNSGSTCNSITLTANGQTITMSNLGMADGEIFLLTYDYDDIQSLKVWNRSTNVRRSVIAKRTVASVDDIWLTSGSNTVTGTSDVALHWLFSTEGRWI